MDFDIPFNSYIFPGNDETEVLYSFECFHFLREEKEKLRLRNKSRFNTRTIMSPFLFSKTIVNNK